MAKKSQLKPKTRERPIFVFVCTTALIDDEGNFIEYFAEYSLPANSAQAAIFLLEEELLSNEYVVEVKKGMKLSYIKGGKW